jgi:hypothetical protein
MPLFAFAPTHLHSGKVDYETTRAKKAVHAKAHAAAGSLNKSSKKYVIAAHRATVGHRNVATVNVHHAAPRLQTPVPSTEARTLLPMNGGSSTSTSTPVTTVAQAPTGGQASGQVVGPPITLIPDDSPTSPGRTIGYTAQSNKPQKKWSTIAQLYFDAGAEDLIGTFTTLVLRAGERYYDDELDVYFRNETLDTVGTNLPFQQVISGASVGADWRHWFLKNHVFFTVSDGYYLSGPYKDNWDFRVGAVGSFGWQSAAWFTDIYTDLFYVDLLKDTIFTERFRSGPIIYKNKYGQVIAYGVEQGIADTLGTEGSENRAEVGFGVGYIFMGHIALNIDMRAGYAYRGEIYNRTYLNPMIVLSGSF